MKNKVLAVLLAVCMIVSMCVLFASAETKTFAENTYVVTKSGDPITSTTTIGDLQQAQSPKDIKVSAKSSGASVSPLATAVDGGNVESLCTFSPAYSSISGKIIVEGTIGETTASVKVTVSPDAGTVYKVLNKIEGDESATVNPADFDEVSTYTVNGKDSDTISVSGITKVEKLYALTMGLRFYGDSTYKNLNASEIAEIKATYKNVKGNEISVYADTINDLREGTVVTLSTKLKDAETFGNDYAFSCWVDGNGNVKGYSENINWIAGKSASPIYAVYTELKNRVRINYSAGDHGKVAYQEATSTNKVISRDVLTADQGQLSVMEGRKVTFVFTPDDGYEVSHVYVSKNGKDKVDVASFMSLVGNSSVWDALKKLINATNKEVYEYTFTSADLTGFPELIRSIEVEFAPVENFEAPSGLDLPTVEAEGITLGTAGSDGSAEGGNATTVPAEDGAAGSNGGSAVSGVVNPATGSTGAIAVFAVLSVAAGAAFVTAKKKED